MSGRLLWTRVGSHSTQPVPSMATEGAAGYDLSASESVIAYPGEVAMVPTGWSVALPVGCFGLLAIRSGTAVKHCLSLVNGCGIIDSDYRGEIKAAVINHGYGPVEIEAGTRVAQLVVGLYLGLCPEEVDALPATHRGDGGFGSTGK